jgi:hypothetical protein
VHLSFSGRATEVGRRRERETNVLAQLITTEKGLYALPYEDLFSRTRLCGGAVVVPPGKPRSLPRRACDSDSPGRSCTSERRRGCECLRSQRHLRARDGFRFRLIELGTAKPSGDEVSWYLQTDDYEENRLYQAGLLEAPISALGRCWRRSRRAFPSIQQEYDEPASHPLASGVSDSGARPTTTSGLRQRGLPGRGLLGWKGVSKDRAHPPPEVLHEGENLPRSKTWGY